MFDQQVFDDSESVSGGVCVGCRANTAGKIFRFLYPPDKLYSPSILLLDSNDTPSSRSILLIYSDILCNVISIYEK